MGLTFEILKSSKFKNHYRYRDLGRNLYHYYMKKKIVFLTGAGMSVESGLSTFRDADGLWENYPVAQVATHHGWELNSDRVNEFYNMLRLKYKDTKPNQGHFLIKSLEDTYDVTVITQNVDNLHELSGSSKVIHLHGEIMKACSEGEWGPGDYVVDLDPENPVIEPGTLAPDGTLLRPFIVFFEEPVPRMKDAIEEVKTADIFVVIGTSLVVYPAAGLLEYVPADTPIYVIDPGDPDLYNIVGQVTHIKKGASEGMILFIDSIEGGAVDSDASKTTENSGMTRGDDSIKINS